MTLWVRWVILGVVGCVDGGDVRCEPMGQGGNVLGEPMGQGVGGCSR